MKQNKTFLGAIVLFALLFGVFAGIATAEASLRITLINQDPDKANPGKYVDLKFQVENIGQDAANNVVLELVPEYPFTLDPNEATTKTIGSMAAGRQGQDAVLITYHVRVDEKAVSGANKITVRYRKSNTDIWTYQDFDVYVDSESNVLTISSVHTTPEEIVPGNKARIDISLQNMGYNTLRDVSVKMILSAYNGNTLTNLIPLAPISSSSEKKVSFLEAEKTENFSFDVVAEPDALSNVYKVPIIITYVDSSGNTNTINDIVGIVIGSAPDISVQVSGTDIVTAGSKGKVSIEIYNKGLTDAKFVNVVPKETSDVSIISTQNEIYVGSIDSDDYQSFDLNVYVNPTNKDKVSIPLTLTYKDPNNKEYTQDATLDLNLYTPEKAKELGLIKPQQSPIIWIVIGVVIVGFIFLRLVKKNHPGKK